MHSSCGEPFGKWVVFCECMQCPVHDHRWVFSLQALDLSRDIRSHQQQRLRLADHLPHGTSGRLRTNIQEKDLCSLSPFVSFFTLQGTSLVEAFPQ